MIYVGIDPGKDGGIAFIADDGIVEARAAIVGANDRAALLARRYAPSLLRVYIEKSQAFPGQGGVGNHSTGMDYGQWLTILDLYDIPYQIVTVQAWQKVMLAGKPSPPPKPKLPKAGTVPDDERKELKKVHDKAVREHKKNIKAFAATVAQRLFPTVNLKRTEKCAGPHDGAVDALLISEYCRRTWR
jgi:hypothetical protein